MGVKTVMEFYVDLILCGAIIFQLPLLILLILGGCGLLDVWVTLIR